MVLPHTVIPQIYYGGAWHDVTDDVLQSGQVEIVRGYTDEETRRPTVMKWTFNNDSGAYRPTDPLSPLYGLVGRNTYAAVSIDGTVRCYAEASAYRPSQSVDFDAGPPLRGVRTVDLEVSGVLRRIGRWSKVLRSAMYRRITGYADLIGYWPLEDGARASQITNAYPDGLPGVASNVTFQGGAGPGGSDQIVESSATARMGGTFDPTASATSGWQICMSYKLDAVPDATYRPILQWFTSNGHSYSLETNVNSYLLTIKDQAGVLLQELVPGHGSGISQLDWLTIKVFTTVSGGTVTVDLAWYNEGGGYVYFSVDTFAGSPGRLTQWRHFGNVTTVGMLLGHIFGMGTPTVDLLSAIAIHSFEGFVGERAASRFNRLCDEFGIPRALEGTTGETQPMGRQAPDTVMKLLNECAETDDALIFDTRAQPGLTFRTRRSRENQTPALALTWPDDIAPPMMEATDDVGVANVITVSQRDGGEAVASLDTGLLGTADPPTGMGELRRTVDVNVADETAQLGLLAGWWLSRSTVDRPRYPVVTLDLDANPHLAAGAAAVEIGDLITIDGLEADQVPLIVIGTREVATNHGRTIAFTCVPGDVFRGTDVYDATTARYGSSATTVKTTVAAGVTSVIFRTTDRKALWSTTHEPYDVLISGERVTVTTMAAATGTGPYDQTATVVRAVNGVAKTLPAGSAVRMADPTRYSL